MMPGDGVRVSPRKRSVDKGLEDPPFKRPKLTVSEEQTFTLPPRLRKFQRRQEENRKQLTLEGSVVSLPLVTRFITEDDICEMLLEMGIKVDAITRVVLRREDALVSISFSNVDLAKEAFNLLCYNQSKPDTTTSRTQRKVIDLTQDSESDDLVAPIVIGSNCGPHRGPPNESSDEDDSDSDTDDDQSSSILIPSSTNSHANVLEETKDRTLEEYIIQQPPGSLGAFELSSLNSSVLQLQHPSRHQPRKNSKTQTHPRSSSIRRKLAGQTLAPGVQVVAVPKAAYNQARRILVPDSAGLPLLTVSMRADLQFYDRTNRYRLSKFSLPNENAYRHVIDAAIVGDTTVVTYDNGPCQVSFVRLVEGQYPSLIDVVNHSPHRRGKDSTKACNGVSSLAPHGHTGDTVNFFTGGYDKAVRLWKVNTSNLDSATSEEVIKLATIPETLAFRQSRHSLLTSTSKRLMDVDLGHLSKKPAGFPMSNPIYQLHVQKENQNVVILEVGHWDSQIQIYDDRRKPGFDRASDCCFGGRHGVPVKASKGDVHLTFFAKGYDDGTIAIWDFRNANRPVLRKQHKSTGPIMHVTFLTTDSLVCYGKNGLTYLNILDTH